MPNYSIQEVWIEFVVLLKRRQSWVIRESKGFFMANQVSKAANTFFGGFIKKCHMQVADEKILKNMYLWDAII